MEVNATIVGKRQKISQDFESLLNEGSVGRVLSPARREQ